jgi:predicted metal-dependent hydrolase
MPDDLALDPDDAVAEAQRLLDAGLPFNAHDVLEGVWKAAPAAERELWRALAQVAVGLTHAQRGNARGAVALLNRAADGIGRWVGPAPAALDLDGVRAQAEELAGRIERAGVAGLADRDLHVRLRG